MSASKVNGWQKENKTKRNASDIASDAKCEV